MRVRFSGYEHVSYRKIFSDILICLLFQIAFERLHLTGKSRPVVLWTERL